MLDIEKKITIKLTEVDVKEIIAEYLSKKGYKVPADNVTLDVESKWVGYGLSEHQVHYFKGCTVVMKGE